jgi:hypothetical protein
MVLAYTPSGLISPTGWLLTQYSQWPSFGGTLLGQKVIMDYEAEACCYLALP